MTDVFSRAHRSWIMSRVRGRDTVPEKALYVILRRAGFRVHRHDRSLPASPDFVLPNEKIVLLVHGCLWHAHPGCSRARLPATNRRFWRQKIEGNRRRDRRQVRALRQAGWSVAVFWTCRRLTPTIVLARIRAMLSRR